MLCCVLFIQLAVATLGQDAEPNPPIWPASVQVFGPGDDGAAQAAVNAAYTTNGRNGGDHDHGQFSDQRFAFLFKPGSYNIEVPVGYYTQVAGLGERPTDVRFTSAKGVYCQEGTFEVGIGALNTFWRSAENFESSASFDWFNGISGMLWAASQASPVRRVRQNGDFIMYYFREGEGIADYSSGGFLGNSMITGSIFSGSQQQYLVRNCDVAWQGGVWNMVFLGTNGAPSSHCGRSDEDGPFVNAGVTPSIAEKPFISITDSGSYMLNIPQTKKDRQGSDWDVGEQVDFSRVYVADAARDTAARINAKLAAGLHVVFAPGIYHLEAPLHVTVSNQVLLGLGLATLVADNSEAAIKVGNVDGVRVAGVLLQAGEDTFATKVLLQWGTSRWAGVAANPGYMHDVFFRVGGNVLSGVSADVMLEVNSGHVLGDNLWLWRADHGAGGAPVVEGDNPCLVGAVINGDDVTMTGFAVEHTLQDLVQWNGDRGATYFFEAEYPYDVAEEYGSQYVAYRVGDGVSTHSGYGLGIYHYFRDNPVTVATGIACPPHLESSFQSPVGVFLKGLGTMLHIINDKGPMTSPADEGGTAKWFCGNSLRHGTNQTHSLVV